MNRATPKVQRLATGSRCDELGCSDISLWFVEYESSSFNWCRRHMVAKMGDSGFWVRTWKVLKGENDTTLLPPKRGLYRVGS